MEKSIRTLLDKLGKKGFDTEKKVNWTSWGRRALTPRKK